MWDIQLSPWKEKKTSDLGCTGSVFTWVEVTWRGQPIKSHIIKDTVPFPLTYTHPLLTTDPWKQGSVSFSLLSHLHPGQFSWLGGCLLPPLYPNFTHPQAPSTSYGRAKLALTPEAFDTGSLSWPPVTSTTQSSPNCICYVIPLTSSCMCVQSPQPGSELLQRKKAHTHTHTQRFPSIVLWIW
jgi:hypothetical protein